jgi:hypothetical protein
MLIGARIMLSPWLIEHLYPSGDPDWPDDASGTSTRSMSRNDRRNSSSTHSHLRQGIIPEASVEAHLPVVTYWKDTSHEKTALGRPDPVWSWGLPQLPREPVAPQEHHCRATGISGHLLEWSGSPLLILIGASLTERYRGSGEPPKPR